MKNTHLISIDNLQFNQIINDNLTKLPKVKKFLISGVSSINFFYNLDNGFYALLGIKRNLHLNFPVRTFGGKCLKYAII